LKRKKAKKILLTTGEARPRPKKRRKQPLAEEKKQTKEGEKREYIFFGRGALRGAQFHEKWRE